MKAFKLPSQTKLYKLGDGWMSKETADGHRALYHPQLFRPKRWYEQLYDHAGMATVYSDAWTKVRAARMTSPASQSGSARAIIWDVAALPAGNIADVIVLGKIYNGDRVIGGRETHSALTSAGGAATGSVGTYAVLADGISLGAVDSAARYLAATDWDAAGSNLIATTQALGYGHSPTADLFLAIVNSVEAFATAGVLKGHLEVVRT